MYSPYIFELILPPFHLFSSGKIRDNQSNLQEGEKQLRCLIETITEAEQKHSLLTNEFGKST
jgi:hypothetical protein